MPNQPAESRDVASGIRPRAARPVQKQLRLPCRLRGQVYAEGVDEVLRLHPVVEERGRPIVARAAVMVVQGRVRADSADGLHRIDRPRVIAEMVVDVTSHVGRVDSLHGEHLDAARGEVGHVEARRDRLVAARHRADGLRPHCRVDGGGIGKIDDVVVGVQAGRQGSSFELFSRQPCGRVRGNDRLRRQSETRGREKSTLQAGVPIDVLLPIVIAMMMLAVGMGLRPADFRAVAAAPLAVVLGLVGMFGVFPLLAFAVAAAFRLEPALAIGLVLLAASPSASTSTMFTYLGRGDVALSVALTAVSKIVPVVTVPVYVSLAAQAFAGERLEIEISFAQTSEAIVATILLPTLAGMALDRYVPAARIWRPHVTRASGLLPVGLIG